MNFKKRYSMLNVAQKTAVDLIDGPVMVIAGPGTGKTELLGVRAANILLKTDTLPENILCLTFTDSGANSMRKRLTEIIGKDAYKVAIHTFHSFGTEVINQNGQYFYEGANFRPADGLSSYQILNNIFEKLDHNNPIAKKLNEEYSNLRESSTVISEFKKSSFTSDEILLILDENDKVIEECEKLLSPIFDCGIKKDTAERCSKHIEEIKQINDKIIIPTTIKLSTVLADSLLTATDEAFATNSTKPITAWRNVWFTKNIKGKFVLKSRDRQIKLRALSNVYNQYLLEMQTAQLYDFDDMILRVVHAMEIFDDLRFNLQEKYQYIMVDEFQDTNMAQMRILQNLTNNIASGGKPNILVVGDDDQAIYSFQGADISNIINFRSNYPDVKIITLTENYRSTADILASSREVILQGNERLENIIDGINKNLTANITSSNESVFIHSAETISTERHWVASTIKSLIDSGKKPGDIAVLTRQHKEINALLPYLYNAGISVNYERRDNVLEQPPVILIEQISQLLIDISDGRHSEVNTRLPQILAHKAFNIKPIDLWKLSISAYDNHIRWLDIMFETEQLLPMYNWLINTASLINDTPLEQILDIIIGKPNNSTSDDKTEFNSPFYEYFFSKDKLSSNPNEYLIYLEALRTIRSKLREYIPDQTPTLKTFIEFISLNRKIGSTISAVRSTIQTDDAINVMTAHKSKGLEFDTVFVINAVDSAWGEKSKGHNRSISYPENLRLAPAGENEDERLRLFYVSITRAKCNLHISYSLANDNGKNTLPASFLVNEKWNVQPITFTNDINELVNTSELAWYQPLIEPVSSKMHDLLLPILDNYKLSVTHLNNFIDVTNDGPSLFLMQNLLRFPTAKSPSASFGTAIHNILQQAHTQFIKTNKKQTIQDILSNYKSVLESQHLNKHDFEHYLKKGNDVLTAFFDEKYDSFNQQQMVELSFSSQQCIVDNTHLTGNLDLIDINIDDKLIIVTDYKTGTPADNWNGKDEYAKIKLHKYKQQLMFYKLLIENSRDYSKYQVEQGIMQFVEPNKMNEILSLSTSFNNTEMKDFKKLINAVFKHIKELNLPDISNYPKNIKGINAFEQDLINNII